MDKLNFSEALKLDLAHREMSEAGLGKALGISQQAIHKWIDRGFPPMSRVADLREVLGANSNFAKLTHEELFGDHTSRTPSPHRVEDRTPYYARKTGIPSTDNGLDTFVRLFGMLPQDSTIRSKVLVDCIRIVSAALPTHDE